MKKFQSFPFLLILWSVFIISPELAEAQVYDMVLKGGHVIDPKNNINEVMDVAVQGNKIAAVAKNIDVRQAKLVIDGKSLYVTPGLIDIHGHFFPGAGRGDPSPDGFTLRSGVTTAVDAGSSGWKSFPAFKKETIDKAKTRIFAFLNIVGEGFAGKSEQDTSDMNAKLTADFALKNKEHIVGFKVAHYNRRDWVPIDRAAEAGRLAGGLPIMIDFGGATPFLPLDSLYRVKFKPGDIYTHMFGGNPLTGETRPGGREANVNSKGQVKPFVLAAQKRGVIFDVGFGGASFSFAQAIPALKSGFFPNTMGTDMNYHSFGGSMKDILNVMSSLMAIGMDLQSAIKAATWSPAQVIKHPELGHLSVGAVADIAVLNVRQGDFGFWDKDNYKVMGKQKLECELTVRDGKVVYDFRGIAVPLPAK